MKITDYPPNGVLLVAENEEELGYLKKRLGFKPRHPFNAIIVLSTQTDNYLCGDRCQRGRCNYTGGECPDIRDSEFNYFSNQNGT